MCRQGTGQGCAVDTKTTSTQHTNRHSCGHSGTQRDTAVDTVADKQDHTPRNDYSQHVQQDKKRQKGHTLGYECTESRTTNTQSVYV